MVESIVIPESVSGKRHRYQILLPQITALVQGEPDLIANVANIVAALKEAMGFFWVGVYFVKNNELVLGPFQGPVACTRIKMGKGVCGTSWKEKKTIRVDDVELFPGHIACNAQSKSEIVLPALKNNEVFMVLDVDSNLVSDFDDDDEQYLGEIIRLIETL